MAKVSTPERLERAVPEMVLERLLDIDRSSTALETEPGKYARYTPLDEGVVQEEVAMISYLVHNQNADLRMRSDDEEVGQENVLASHALNCDRFEPCLQTFVGDWAVYLGSVMVLEIWFRRPLSSVDSENPLLHMLDTVCEKFWLFAESNLDLKPVRGFHWFRMALD